MGVDPNSPIRVAFVVHVMQVAGAEVLVSEIINRSAGAIEPLVICLDAVGVIGERLRARGIPVVVMDRRPGIDLGVARRIGAILRDQRVEVLHAHQYSPFFYAAIGATLSRSRTKVLFTEHGRHWPDLVSRKRRLANRLLLARRADRITGVSAFSVRGLIEQDGFPAERIEIIENGIDPAKYHSGRVDKHALKRRLGLDPSRRYVSSIGRFHPVKDHRTLIKAFASVAQEMPAVDLLLAGDGPLRPDLQALVAELGLDHRVQFLGVRRDVADLLAASDLLALASLSEAASITVLEAMASERPVVVTAVGGNPEMVRPGVDGLLTPRGDGQAMASAMLEVLRDEAQAFHMGRSGRQHVEARYRIESTISRYLKLYRDLARGFVATS